MDKVFIQKTDSIEAKGEKNQQLRFVIIFRNFEKSGLESNYKGFQRILSNFIEPSKRNG